MQHSRLSFWSREEADEIAGKVSWDRLSRDVGMWLLICLNRVDIVVGISCDKTLTMKL